MQFSSPDQLFKYLDDEGVRFHKIGVFDVDGIFRGKYVNRAKLESAVRKGFGFCDVVLGWDSTRSNSTINVASLGLAYGVPRCGRPSSTWATLRRRFPSEDDTLLLIGQLRAATTRQVCPRARSSRRMPRSRAREHGLPKPDAAFEYEFFLFDETPR